VVLVEEKEEEAAEAEDEGPSRLGGTARTGEEIGVVGAAPHSSRRYYHLYIQ
jgi:hypothetical protein